MHKNSLWATTVYVCSSDKPQSWVILCLLPHIHTHTHKYVFIPFFFFWSLLLPSLFIIGPPISHHSSAPLHPTHPPPRGPSVSSSQPLSCCVISCSSQWKQPQSNNSRLPRCTAAPTAAATAASNKHTTAKMAWQERCGCWRFHTEADTDPCTHMNAHTSHICVFLLFLWAFSWTLSSTYPFEYYLWYTVHLRDQSCIHLFLATGDHSKTWCILALWSWNS